MNFIICGLARSRTKWLSEFLTYKDHTCGHELAVTFRKPSDYKKYFSNPNVGSAETGVAQGYWLIKEACPDIKTVLVRRKLQDSVDSVLDIDLKGVAIYDKDLLTKHFTYTDRILDKISKEPGVLSTSYEDLKYSQTCKKIFEHCLPYEFDIKHWGSLKNKNIQVDFREHLKYYHENISEINEFKRLCKLEMIQLKRAGKI